jgi:Tfp pilus assembly protein PilO
VKPENRQKFLLILAVAAVALLAGDYLILTPLQKAWKARSTRITQLEEKIRAGRGVLDREQALRSRWQAMTANTLPKNMSAAEQKLLQAFDEWSRESRLNLTSLNPQWRTDADDHLTLQCRVEATGDLGTITSFLYSVETDPMAIRVDSLELASRDATGSQVGMTLQVSGLVLTLDEQERSTR